MSDGSTIEADDLESFYSESDPLNGTLTEQDLRFSFESDLSSEFKIPRVLVSSSDDDSRQCNESEDNSDEIDGAQNLNQIDPLDSLLFDSWQPVFASSKPLICQTLDDDESEFSGGSSSTTEQDENCNDDVIEDEIIALQNCCDENRNKDDDIGGQHANEQHDNVIGTCCDQSVTRFSADYYVNGSNLLEYIATLEGGSFGAKSVVCLEENPIYRTIREIFKELGSRYLEVVFLEPLKWQKMGSEDCASITSCNRFLELRRDGADATSYVLNWKDAEDEFKDKGDVYDANRTNEEPNEANTDSKVVEEWWTTNVLTSSNGRFDGMPNARSYFGTVSEPSRATGVVKDKQPESVTGGRQLTDDEDVPVAEHGIHATMASDTDSKTVAGRGDDAYDNNGGSVKNDLDECGCWKSLSNDARPDLRKWRTFPPSLGEIMRSLNSSKLDLTGRVPLSELYHFEARTSCNNERFAFAASCIDDCANFATSDCVRDSVSCLDRGGDVLNSRFYVAAPDVAVQPSEIYPTETLQSSNVIVITTNSQICTLII
ncbi:hypothetical protein U1Q18_051003 [Sarracenia purpurea var. burkii]